MKYICFILGNIFISINLFSQNFSSIHIGGAYAYNISSRSSGGMQLKAQYIYVKKGNGFYLEYQNNYTESTGIFENQLKNPKSVVRTKYNPKPIDLPGFIYTFDKYYLDPKPNKFTDISFSIGYLFRKQSERSSFSVQIGPLINYHYEVLIRKIISGTYRVIVSNEFIPADIPLYEYNSYYELGLTSSVNWMHQIKKKLSGGFFLGSYWLPQSNNGFITIGGILSVQINK